MTSNRRWYSTDCNIHRTGGHWKMFGKTETTTTGLAAGKSTSTTVIAPASLSVLCANEYVCIRLSMYVYIEYMGTARSLLGLVWLWPSTKSYRLFVNNILVSQVKRNSLLLWTDTLSMVRFQQRQIVHTAMYTAIVGARDIGNACPHPRLKHTFGRADTLRMG